MLKCEVAQTVLSLLSLGEAPRLKIFAVNHASNLIRVLPLFEQMQERVQQVQSVALRMIILGMRMWFRKAEDEQWVLTDAVPYKEWPWLAHPDHGKWLLDWQRMSH